MQYGTYQGNLLISCVWLCLLQFAIHNWTRQTDRQADRETDRLSGSLFQFSAFSVIFMTTFCILLRHTHTAGGVNGKHIQVTQIQQSTHVPNNMPKHTLTHTEAEHHVLSPNNNNGNNSNWLWNFLSAYTKNTIVIIIIVLGIGKAIMHIRHINMTKAKTWILLGSVCVWVWIWIWFCWEQLPGHDSLAFIVARQLPPCLLIWS